MTMVHNTFAKIWTFFDSLLKQNSCGYLYVLKNIAWFKTMILFFCYSFRMFDGLFNKGNIFCDILYPHWSFFKIA